MSRLKVYLVSIGLAGLLFAFCIIAFNTQSASAAFGCIFEPVGGDLYRVGTFEDGNQAPGTISPVRFCNVPLPEFTNSVQIGSYSAPSGPGNCMPAAWSPTNNNPSGSFNYTAYIDSCPNNVKGFADDGVHIQFPGGEEICSAFPTAGCTTPDFIADMSTNTPRSAGYLKQNVGPASGTELSGIPVTDGYKDDFIIRFRVKQQYLDGFRAWVYLRITTGPPCDPLVDPDCPPPPTDGPSCPNFDPIITNEELPESGIPESTDAERHSYNGKTEVNNIIDQWGQQAVWEGGTNGSVNVDYTPYARDYPYDIHNPIIYYTRYYDTDHYEYEKVGTETQINDDGEEEEVDVYDWVYKNTTTDHATTEQTTEATPMDPECYWRKYDTTMEYGTVAWNDVENPSFIQFTIDMDTEYLPNAPGPKTLREDNRVTLPVDTTITLYHADGSSETYPTSGAVTGSSCDNRLINNNFTTTPSSSFNVTVEDESTNCRPVSFPTLRVGDYACVTVTLTHGLGDMNHQGAIQIGGPERMLEPSPQGVSNGTNNGCTQKIVNRPYFNVSKGDILAGACSTVPGAMISSWYTPSRGAGTTLAAYALGAIEEFASAATRGSSPTPTRGLSFANQAGTYGGFWGAEPPCNSFGVLGGGAAFASGSSLDSLSGTLSAPGNIEIPASTLSSGQRIVITTPGDVRITGNIQKSAGNSYVHVNDIASVRIIANNIYIAPDVTNIDALLFATNQIMTCTDPTTNTRPSAAQAAQTVAQNANSCQRKLTIRGALTARKIWFLRTNGSLRSGSNADYSSGGSGNTAEHIIFSPSAWLSSSPQAAEELSPYKAYTNMPPIL